MSDRKILRDVMAIIEFAIGMGQAWKASGIRSGMARDLSDVLAALDEDWRSKLYLFGIDDSEPKSPGDPSGLDELGEAIGDALGEIFG